MKHLFLVLDSQCWVRSPRTDKVEILDRPREKFIELSRALLSWMMNTGVRRVRACFGEVPWRPGLPGPSLAVGERSSKTQAPLYMPSIDRLRSPPSVQVTTAIDQEYNPGNRTLNAPRHCVPIIDLLSPLSRSKAQAQKQ